MAPPKRRISAVLIWAGVIAVMAVPVLIAATSPYLAYRNPAYIAGGFGGIVGLALFLIQPLLAARYLPGSAGTRGRRWHNWVGTAIVTCVVIHIAGLYLTSAPDTLDALLLVAPTPFSVYGVVAMWGIVATGLLVIFRRRLPLRYSTWRVLHNGLALIVVVATVIHAVQIEGAMEIWSKWALCLVVLAVTLVVLVDLRVIRPLLRRRKSVRAD